MMNLICVGNGDIPVMMEVVSGNQADKARFSGLLQEFKKQWTFEGICVADAALYSEENLVAMTGLKWLTRVPLSIKAAGELVETTTGLQASKLKGHNTVEAKSEYGGVSQRWILVESQERLKSDIKKFRQKSPENPAKLCAGAKDSYPTRFCLCSRCDRCCGEIINQNEMAQALAYSDNRKTTLCQTG